MTIAHTRFYKSRVGEFSCFPIGAPEMGVVKHATLSAVYISKEYLDEVAFNSQSNVYFGYTLAELDEVFQGTRYIFTLGDDGNTTVRELQAIDDPQAPPGYIPAPHIPSLSESPSGRFCPDGSRNYCPRTTVHRLVLAAVQLPAG